jgi:hypothetical protein
MAKVETRAATVANGGGIAQVDRALGPKVLD